MANLDQIRKASLADWDKIQEIYEFARGFMRENGNPTQWGTTYPEEELLQRDIAQQKLHVVVRDGQIVGVFYFAVEKDPTYGKIEDGAWLSDAPYGVIHRVAAAGCGGVLASVLAYCKTQNSHLRIDTHHDNLVMQRALEKRNFHRCGIVYMLDGSPRIAYEQL